MAVRTKVVSIDRDVRLIADELLSPAARQRQFADSAREILRDTDETNRQALGRIPRSATYVDGRLGADLASVKPNGAIVREYDLFVDVLIFIAAQLERDSPIAKRPDKRPGHPGYYKASHTLFADGTEVAVNQQIPAAAQYVFLSDAPYSRKIEKWFAVYERVAGIASRRLGNVAKIYFGWRAPASGRLLEGPKGNRSDGRFPAIIIRTA